MIDMKKIFFPTQKVDVLIDDAATGKKRVFNSRIEDIQENRLIIAAPYSQGYFLPPHSGREIHARVTSNDCAFLFMVKLRSYVHDPVALWTISWPTDVERVQMRSYVRFEVLLDVRLMIIDEDNAKPISTITKDISAGGLRVMMGTPLPVGTQLDIAFNLDEENVVEAKGEVVRIIRPKADHDKYAVAIRYSQIDEKVRGKVIKFIFKKQIERRKKLLEIFED